MGEAVDCDRMMIDYFCVQGGGYISTYSILKFSFLDKM